MVLERVFKRAATIERFRKNPLWIVLDGFCRWLLDHGYNHESVRIHIWQVGLLADYLYRRGLAEPAAVTWIHIEAFLRHHLSEHRSHRSGLVRHRGIRRAVRRLTEYLVFAGILPLPPAPPPPPYQALLEEHLIWLKDYCRRSAHTLALRRRYLIPFFEWMGAERLRPERLSELSPCCLQGFFLDYAKGAGVGKAACMATALRTFCRFCLHRGYLRRDLTGAIPSFVRYRLSRIPRGISEEDAQKLLDSIERQTPRGLRDYAIMRLLHTYGLRPGQVARLSLADIQWVAGRIRFDALKGGKTVIAPMTDAVAHSLLAYLRRGRPPSSRPEVFLTARPPGHPMSSAPISLLVGRRLESAGIRISPHGAGVFRHGLATRLLAAGHSLKAIADLLGHRDIQTTAIYAKVDFRRLEQVALEWPEDAP